MDPRGVVFEGFWMGTNIVPTVVIEFLTGKSVTIEHRWGRLFRSGGRGFGKVERRVGRIGTHV